MNCGDISHAITDHLLLDVAEGLAVAVVAGLVVATASTVINHHQSAQTEKCAFVILVSTGPAYSTANNIIRIVGTRQTIRTLTRSYPSVLYPTLVKRVTVKDLGLKLGLVLVLALAVSLRLRVTVGVRVKVRDAWGTKRLGTKKSGYDMSGSRHRVLSCNLWRYVRGIERILFALFVK